MCEDSENVSRVVRMDVGNGFVDVELTSGEDPCTLIGVCEDLKNTHCRVSMGFEELNEFIKILQAQQEKVRKMFT